MSWFKVDDKFHSHPKAMKAGTPACGLWARCGAWVSDQLTDGMIPGEVARMYGTDELIENLVKAGLWEVEPEGYKIHDYLDYNPSREKVLADREAARTRQQRSRSHRDSRGESQPDEGDSEPDDGAPTDESRVSHAVTLHRPNVEPPEIGTDSPLSQRDSRVSSDAPYPTRTPSSSSTYEPQNFTVTNGVSHGVTDGVTSPPRSTLRTALAATDRGNALLDEHLDQLRTPLPRAVIRDLGRQIDLLVEESFDDHAIRGGLRLLRSNKRFAASPNMLPRFVGQFATQQATATRAPEGQVWG